MTEVSLIQIHHSAKAAATAAGRGLALDQTQNAKANLKCGGLQEGIPHQDLTQVVVQALDAPIIATTAVHALVALV